MSGSESEIGYVRLDGDPEAVAEGLMEDEAPDRMLNEVALRDREDGAQLLMYLSHRTRYFSIDREEIEGFAERNGPALEDWGLDLLENAAGALRAEDPGFADHLLALARDVRRALDGDAREIERPSPRLVWLVIALGMQVQAEQLTHSEARETLRRPRHRARVNRATLGHMLIDLANNRDAAYEGKTEYAMVIAEAALDLGDPGVIAAALVSLSVLHPPTDVEAWADVVRRLGAQLRADGRLTPAHESFLARVERRVAPAVPDDDL